ncbi:hypothetical protein AGABI1DRAFT_111912 [Agaricus bisporus var. burnettii JB137-S8]|uniref:Uncharacterized protein n=1 Tax=Agaricus bisporus var. burnettii (strain JB137-S8 / ATCC MYA-4627 / FGSC 10392) TaxID=597362 RepID=K5XE67_AGABU|nr:uncharacterized protein AGABI1DRAFT_111912 [Agaricus bisporus var. burnettii JB137-S8]EKM81633.1 hypothetical protein AGABI1DRAFT_111912 [Agaricus bisporus var. burnettii JB137-S8]
MERSERRTEVLEKETNVSKNTLRHHEKRIGSLEETMSDVKKTIEHQGSMIVSLQNEIGHCNL